MSYNTINNFLLLRFRWYTVDRYSLMKLGLASVRSLVSVKHFINIKLLLTTRKFVRWAKWTMKIHFDLRSSCVVPTIAHLSNWVIVLASITLKHVQIWPHLPVDLFPRYSIGFSNVGDEFFKIPITINDMFSAHLPIAVDKVLSFPTRKNFTLLFCKQLGAEGTLVQVILFFL